MKRERREKEKRNKIFDKRATDELIGRSDVVECPPRDEIKSDLRATITDHRRRVGRTEG